MGSPHDVEMREFILAIDDVGTKREHDIKRN